MHDSEETEPQQPNPDAEGRIPYFEPPAESSTDDNR